MAALCCLTSVIKRELVQNWFNTNDMAVGTTKVSCIFYCQYFTNTIFQIHIPLPPKIDPSVTMMQVEEKPDVTYSDVGGCKEQIEKLREVVETPLLHPERFVNLGIEPPKGVLLYGPPGTGKTLCARAVANRTDACFIRVIGSELVQKVISICTLML
jgi:ATP-dependent 26S proteasome regulatory subunit